MRCKAVLFDLDGTLLDTLGDLGNAVNRVLSARGFPTHDMDSYRYLVGEGVLALVANALPHDKRDEETVRSCLKDFQADYRRAWNVETRPYDGVPELLAALKEKKFRIAVFSNKPHEFTELCVSQFLGAKTFDMVLGHKDGAPRKPDPAGAVETARGLGVAQADFLYVGDSGIDMKTAVAAGMFPVGVLWGFRPEEELMAHGARRLIKRPAELLDLVSLINS